MREETEKRQCRRESIERTKNMREKREREK